MTSPFYWELSAVRGANDSAEPPGMLSLGAQLAQPLKYCVASSHHLVCVLSSQQSKPTSPSLGLNLLVHLELSLFRPWITGITHIWKVVSVWALSWCAVLLSSCSYSSGNVWTINAAKYFHEKFIHPTQIKGDRHCVKFLLNCICFHISRQLFFEWLPQGNIPRNLLVVRYILEGPQDLASLGILVNPTLYWERKESKCKPGGDSAWDYSYSANAYWYSWGSGKSSFTFQQHPGHVAKYFTRIPLRDEKQDKVLNTGICVKNLNLWNIRHAFLVRN